MASSNFIAPPEDRGDGRLREIVGGGAEAAGGDHGARAVERLPHRGRDLSGASPTVERRTTPIPARREFAGEVRGVGVDGESEQELVADGDDFDVHVRGCGLISAVNSAPYRRR